MTRLILFIVSGMLLLGGSTVAYSQNKDLFKLKCTAEENSKYSTALFYYELDFKKSKHKTIAQIYDKKVIRTNVNLLENKKFSRDKLRHFDEKIFSTDGEEGKYDLILSHKISFEKINVSISVISFAFVTGNNKIVDAQLLKLSCIEISSFPKFELDKK